MRETRRSRPLGVVTAFVLAVASLAVGTSPASAAVTCGGQVATIVGTPGADTIRGAGTDTCVAGESVANCEA
jgi:hypothetical protein